MIFRKNEIKKIIINQNCSLFNAIKIMNETGLKIVIVAGKNSKILGTVVDGDIRRGLINEINLESKISKILNKSPITSKKNL